MFINLSIDPVKTTVKITSFIKTTLRKVGFSRVVIGLSGGVDSSTTCFLAVKALGVDNVYSVLMPYGSLNKQGVKDAKSVIAKLKIPKQNVFLVDVKPMTDKVAKHDSSIDKLRRGNIAVRIRMILLFDLAKKLDALVLGTENRTEYLLGYFTRFGDEASDIEPLRGLYKTQVRQLAKYLGVPDKIIKKPPSAGMWQGQTDEKEFGFSYEAADQILFLYHEKKYSSSQIVNKGFDKKIVKKVLERVEDNDFKHKLPHIIDL